MRNIIIFLMLALLTACTSHPKLQPKTMPYVNLHQYMGAWYEMASFPTYFQRGCHCTKAQYALNAHDVSVHNSCVKNHKWTGVHAKAWAIDNSNSRLRVRFFWPFYGNYWILYVSPNYQYAVVGGPGYDYLWILSRTPNISKTEYDKLVSIAKSRGYDVSKLHKTLQNCGLKRG